MTEDPIKFVTFTDAITLQKQQPASFSFGGADGRILITIKPDGTVERGPAFTTTDAASLEFWNVLERLKIVRADRMGKALRDIERWCEHSDDVPTKKFVAGVSALAKDGLG